VLRLPYTSASAYRHTRSQIYRNRAQCDGAHHADQHVRTADILSAEIGARLSVLIVGFSTPPEVCREDTIRLNALREIEAIFQDLIRTSAIASWMRRLGSFSILSPAREADRNSDDELTAASLLTAF